MEEKRPTPLPPGVIPSSSNEDLYAQLQADSDVRKREEKLLGPVRRDACRMVRLAGHACVVRRCYAGDAEFASFRAYEAAVFGH